MSTFCDAATEWDGELIYCYMPADHPEAHSATIWWEDDEYAAPRAT